MSEREAFFDRLCGRLEQARVPYMVVGSVAGGFHGVPRTTNDIDVVIDPTEEQLVAFLRTIDDDWYVSEEGAIDEHRRRGMFNVIESDTGWKADLIFRKNRPYSIEEFERRKTGRLLGRSSYVASAEDVVLSKLEWAKMGSSDRQRNDAANVLKIRRDVDWDYLHEWAGRLGIVRELEAQKRRVDREQGGGEIDDESSAREDAT